MTISSLSALSALTTSTARMPLAIATKTQSKMQTRPWGPLPIPPPGPPPEQASGDSSDSDSTLYESQFNALSIEDDSTDSTLLNANDQYLALLSEFS
ncbi:hypothetical protein AB4874_08100 [Thioclava sp. 15-R06ZXC-3]|uniref:Uncharacterized protein n=1 Tax=Thioclava arctica TaxID=3238301 RepID=A0ABV3TKZ5_9RHOB